MGVAFSLVGSSSTVPPGKSWPFCRMGACGPNAASEASPGGRHTLENARYYTRWYCSIFEQLKLKLDLTRCRASFGSPKSREARAGSNQHLEECARHGG